IVVVKERRGVDDVVAVPLEGVGEAEDPFVVFVLLVGKMRERIERLLAELEPEPVVAVAGIPDAVLARVAIDDERAVGSGAAGDDEVVAADPLPAGAGDVVGDETQRRDAVLAAAIAERRVE